MMRIAFSGIVAIAATVSAILAASDENSMIDAARGAALVFATTLPDYLVTRTTTRYEGQRPSTPPSGTPVDYNVMPAVDEWFPVDSITARITAVKGKEVYSNISVNGRAAKVLPPGTWSTGEFSSTLLTIFAPQTAARFTNPRTVTLRRRQAYLYDYAVEKSHSEWNIKAGPLPGWPGRSTDIPAYGGSIWIDTLTAQVLRIEMRTDDLPEKFPLEFIVENTDYEYFRIGDHDYCLPSHSEAINCERRGNYPKNDPRSQSNYCWRNETAFRSYEKFGASTSIQFQEPGQ